MKTIHVHRIFKIPGFCPKYMTAISESRFADIFTVDITDETDVKN